MITEVDSTFNLHSIPYLVSSCTSTVLLGYSRNGWTGSSHSVWPVRVIFGHVIGDGVSLLESVRLSLHLARIRHPRSLVT